MIAFNPDKIDINVQSSLVEDEDGRAGIQSNWTMTIPEQGGIAYIRIDPKLREFFQKCKDRAIGFEYDFESLNFGVVMAKEDK